MSKPLRRLLFAAGACFSLAACGRDEPPAPEPPAGPEPAPPSQLVFTPSHWDALPGWATSDPRSGLAAFLRSCETWEDRPDDALLSAAAPWAGRVGDWRAACAGGAMTQDDPEAVRALFEAVFQPVRILPAGEDGAPEGETGLLTAYYEPELRVRDRRRGRFTQPIRMRPPDLVTVDLGRFDDSLAGRSIVGEVEGGRLVPYAERERIEAEDRGDVLAWGPPIDVFFLQIQGSGRIVFQDGRTLRAAYAAHNGQPYRSIGRELIARGELESHAASKAGIEAWLEENGPEATAELFSVNPRYVFFQAEEIADPGLGPRGAAGVRLTPQASIAVDPTLMPYGLPVWLSADLPEAEDWSGLVIAQDTGGAIRGPLRGDFFFGWGEDAERRAGSTRSQAAWTIFLPAALAEALPDALPPA